jgi:cytochrome c oxidase cbb3-type subunit III
VIGPNLTDHYWIHGTGDRKGIIQVVKKGVLEKGMPAWEGLLSDEEVLSVVGYVYSLRNTNPAQPKEPQGEEYKN